MIPGADRAEARAHLARACSELIAVRRARLLSLLVLAAAMLLLGLGAGLQARGEQIEAVLLLSAFGLSLIGIVSALAALVAWTRIDRDLLDTLAAGRPARARAPRTRAGGAAVSAAFILFGLLCAWPLWERTPLLAAAAVVACVVLAGLGPIWAHELVRADDHLAAALDADAEFAARFADFTAPWLEDALGRAQEDALGRAQEDRGQG